MKNTAETAQSRAAGEIVQVIKKMNCTMRQLPIENQFQKVRGRMFSHFKMIVTQAKKSTLRGFVDLVLVTRK